MTDREDGSALKANQFLFDLKARTAPMHVRLESSGISKNLMADNVSMANYIQYLEGMHDLTAFTESKVFPGTSSIITDLGEREKLSWLKEDLDHLSGKAEANPNAYTHIRLESLGEKLGWVYVVEGSTLGGRIILKYLNGKFDDLSPKGSRFLEGYGAETGMRWKEFLSHVSKYAIENNKEDEVIDGAVKAFNAIYQNFNV